MNIENIESINESGFSEIKRISELKADASLIPKTKGVYLVLRPDNDNVEFVEKGMGGFFKDRNPNVQISELRKNWIDDANIVYIGKAGGSNKKATLRSRLKQYLNFGKGKKVGHWGGRYIWQLKKIDDYFICWKELSDDEPRNVEIKLMELFRQKYNNLPFANIAN
jgi:hypothetical protein